MAEAGEADRVAQAVAGEGLEGAVDPRAELLQVGAADPDLDPAFIRFLARLARQVPQKVFLILGGHPAHDAALTRRWLEKHGDRIEVFFRGVSGALSTGSRESGRPSGPRSQSRT